MLTTILWFREYYFHFTGKKYNEVEVTWTLESDIHASEIWISLFIVLKKTFKLFVSQFLHWLNRETLSSIVNEQILVFTCFTVNQLTFIQKAIHIRKSQYLQLIMFQTLLYVKLFYMLSHSTLTPTGWGGASFFPSTLQLRKLKLRDMGKPVYSLKKIKWQNWHQPFDAVILDRLLHRHLRKN